MQVTKQIRLFSWCALLSVLSVFSARADQTVTLAWDPASAVDGYALYYGTTSGGYSNRIDTGTNTSFVVSGLKEGATYYFSVVSYAQGVESDRSSEVSYIVPGVIAAGAKAPDGSIQLSFPTAANHSYEVQMSEDLVTWTTVVQTNATDNCWLNINDTSANGSSSPRRFYRLLMK